MKRTRVVVVETPGLERDQLVKALEAGGAR